MYSVTRLRRFDASLQQIRDAIDDAFERMGATGIRWSNSQFTVRASMPMMILISYGEELKVELFEDGEVEVNSRYTFPLQIFDWIGKNYRNCDRFLNGVEDYLESIND